MKTFDQFLAETGQQSKLDELRGKGGYDEAKAAYEAGRSPYTTSTSAPSSSTSFANTIQEAIRLNQQAAQPAIQSLQASIPEVQKKYETTRQQTEAKIEPLKQRYQSLLEDIKGQGLASEQAQTRVTSSELGKRGITGSSTLAQQEIQNAVEPIRSGVRTATKDIGLAQEEGISNLVNIIANLTGQETESVRAITNAIAGLQSGAAQTGIGQGLQQSQFEASQRLAQEQAAAAERQYQEQQAQANKIFEQITLPESKANLANIQSTIANRGTGSIADLTKYLGGGVTSTYQTGFPQVDKLLSQGRYEEARQLLLNP